uniref:palmitoyltransferase ZDHHC22-like n=1 Tax=Styela clava TaxID=7725 RepID=UPI00193A9A2C|nr:palmitoyltransferase ZDHHC22-like [Styela clava]
MGLLKSFWMDFTQTMKAKENITMIHFCCVGYFYLLAFSALYCCLFIAFPIIYRHDDDYNWNLFAFFFLFINMIGNQILGTVYNSTYTDGLILNPPPKSWILCMTCQQHCPPRSHHCPVCQKCILKRDHHCYFFMTCVGIQNLRYFLPFSFYVGIGSLYCVKQMLSYLNYSYVTIEFSLNAIFSYFFPGVMYNYLWSGEGNLNFDKLYCILVLYGSVVTGIGGSFYFLSELFISMRGQTIYEFGKDIRKYDFGFLRNIKQVLWPWGILYFLMPLPVPTKEINAPWGTPKFVKGI